jgi:hypothetical protein
VLTDFLPNKKAKSRIVLVRFPARNKCEEEKRARYEKNPWFNDQFPQQKSRLYRFRRCPNAGRQFGGDGWFAFHSVIMAVRLSRVYSGYPVTLNAFGVDPSGSWENLLETPTGYGNCSFTVPGYEMEELIDSTTSTNGLNPLPNGSITVSWFANCSNFDPFYGYYGSPPYYTGGGPLTNPKTGEQEVYATFLRDGVNFGPNTSGTPAPYGSADNPLQAYYYHRCYRLKKLVYQYTLCG